MKKRKEENRGVKNTPKIQKILKIKTKSTQKELGLLKNRKVFGLSLTQMFGATHTRAVQMSINTGNAIRVAVKPNFFITIPVPNNENKKEIVFVVCGK